MEKSCSLKKQRIPYIDSAKGIGIILVCIGHAITGTGAVGSTFWLEFICQFHMPFFFLISGINFSENYTLHPVTSGFRKIKTYYIPFVIYNMIFVLLHNVFAHWNIIADVYSAGDFVHAAVSVLTFHIQEICGAMWFLRTLLLIFLLFLLIRCVVKRLIQSEKSEFVIGGIVLILAILSLTDLITTVFKIRQSFYYLAFYYLGFLMKKYDLLKFTQKYKGRLVLIGLVINLFLASRYTYAIGGYDGGYIFLIRFIGQLSGSLMVLALSQYTVLSSSKLLHVCGQKSLDIMALHFVCFKPVSYLIIQLYHLDLFHMADIPVVEQVAGFWWILYTVTGLGISIVLRIGYDQIRCFVKTLWEKKNAAAA